MEAHGYEYSSGANGKRIDSSRRTDSVVGRPDPVTARSFARWLAGWLTTEVMRGEN